MSHKSHKFRMMQHNCQRTSKTIYSILECTTDKPDIVMIEEAYTFQDPNDDTWIQTIDHLTFHTVTQKYKPDHHTRVTTYINNTNPYITYQLRLDIIDNPDIQFIEISTPSIALLHHFNLYNQKVETRATELRHGEQVL